MAELDIHIWLKLHGAKNEDGKTLDFRSHLFLVEPYENTAKKMVIKKAAQIGFSTLAIFKTLWMAKHMKLNIIYTLPTFSDIRDFVGGKVNRIVGQNPVLSEYVKDRDTIESKNVGDNLIYYRGTFTEQAALMVSADLLVIDEFDRSKQQVVQQYASRLQHSAYQGEWYFSNPSAPGSGVDKYWQMSDQRHWFITCQDCKKEQYMTWPHSIDQKTEEYICKVCKVVLTEEARRVGRWIAKYPEREFVGYWIPLMIAPWISAKRIMEYSREKSEEYFQNFVMGDCYVGGGNKLTQQHLYQNLCSEPFDTQKDRVVIGVDTGKHIHLVCGTSKGLFYYSESSDYAELEQLMKRFPRAIVVIDQGGDLIGPRKLREKYPGRIFLCAFGEDRKTQELVRWGKKDEFGMVIADRNRMIQLVVDEFIDKRIGLQGSDEDYYDYWLHWNALTRVKEENDKGMIRKIWIRSGADHWALATTYWRVGMMRFGSGEKAEIIGPDKQYKIPTGHEIHNEQTSFNPRSFFKT